MIKDTVRSEQTPPAGETDAGKEAMVDYHLKVLGSLRLPRHTIYSLLAEPNEPAYVYYSDDTKELVYFEETDVRKIIATLSDGLISNTPFVYNTDLSYRTNGYSYRLKGILYNSTQEQFFAIEAASVGKKRVDYILLGSNLSDPNVLQILKGTEGDDFVDPVMPADRILFAKMYVTYNKVAPIHSIIEPEFAKIAGNPTDNRQLLDYLNNLQYLKKNTNDDGTPTPISIWAKQRGSGDPYILRFDSDDNFSSDGDQRWEKTDTALTKFRRYVGTDIFEAFWRWGQFSVYQGQFVVAYLDEIESSGRRPSVQLDPDKSVLKSRVVIYRTGSHTTDSLVDLTPRTVAGVYSHLDVRGIMFGNSLALSNCPEYPDNATALSALGDVGCVYHTAGTLKITIP